MTPENKLRFVIRQREEKDVLTCLALDHTCSSDYVWQVEVVAAPQDIQLSFRTIRLPRSISLSYPRERDRLLASWQRSDCFLIAEGQERIYGYINVLVDTAYDVAWVRDLVVDQPYRRRRVGSALLFQARQWAQEQGLHRLTIETQTKNHPAIAFCERHGLAFCGFNDQHYPNQDIALFFSQALR